MIIDNLLIFISQFMLIYLLGFQSINVVRGYYILAFLTSLALGISGWFTITLISSLDPYNDLFSLSFFVYIFSGPIAIVLAMKTHSLLEKFRKK